MEEGISKAEATRRVASRMMPIENIAQVTNHDGSIGAVDFTVHRDMGLSQSRLADIMPDGWTHKLVITPGPETTLFVCPEE